MFREAAFGKPSRHHREYSLKHMRAELVRKLPLVTVERPLPLLVSWHRRLGLKLYPEVPARMIPHRFFWSASMFRKYSSG